MSTSQLWKDTELPPQSYEVSTDLLKDKIAYLEKENQDLHDQLDMYRLRYIPCMCSLKLGPDVKDKEFKICDRCKRELELKMK